MDLYPWLVITHIVAAFAFVMAHGVSVYVIYRVRQESDRTRLTALLDLSAGSLNLAGISLLVVLVAGIAAGISLGAFSRGWIWASIAVLVVVIGVMTPLAAIPLNKVRHALGLKIRGDKEAPPPASDEELAALRAALRPILPATIGGLGLTALVILMRFKPF
jgi:hypothetical protein